MPHVLQCLNRTISELLPYMTEARRHLHGIPELAFQEARTADYVAAQLAEMGYAPVRGQVGTSVTAVLDTGRPGPYIMLRADMDGLPVAEETGLPFASAHPGRMHACGHDGHMAMLLGAATVLASTGGFDGTVRFFFQPAEEHGRGALAMIDDQVLKRFPVEASGFLSSHGASVASRSITAPTKGLPGSQARIGQTPRHGSLSGRSWTV